MTRRRVITILAAAVAGLAVAGAPVAASAASTPPAAIKAQAVPDSGSHWKARIDILQVCKSYGYSLFGHNGTYCMHMEVPVIYNGTQVELASSVLLSTGKRVTAGTCYAQGVGGGVWEGRAALARAQLAGTYPPLHDDVQAEWCGISDHPWATDWNFTGPSFPVLMQADRNGSFQPVTSQPRRSWDTGDQRPIGNKLVHALYLGMNIQSDVPRFYAPDWPVPFPDSETSYPWMRGTIDAHGRITCTAQGDPPGKPDVFADQDTCDTGSAVAEKPISLGTPPTPAPVPTTPAPPSAAALAAWKATATDSPATVGTALKGVAGLLQSSDAAQVADLNKLAGIPLADLGEDPPAQAAQGHADVTALDNFFNTPGLTPAEGAPTATPVPAGPPPAALAAWKATAGVVAVQLGAALRRVASLLPSSDSSEIAELNQLASLPLTGDTPVQQAENQKDIHDLNYFFSTPGFTPGG